MLLFLKRTISQTFKIRGCIQKSFPSVYIIDTNCFDECFLFRVITGRNYFYTNLALPRGLLKPPWCCYLWNKYFERSPHFISAISATTLQCCLWCPNIPNFLLFKYVDSVFTLSVCEYSTFSFFINGTFKTQKHFKAKSSPEACFY